MIIIVLYENKLNNFYYSGSGAGSCSSCPGGTYADEGET